MEKSDLQPTKPPLHWDAPNILLKNRDTALAELCLLPASEDTDAIWVKNGYEKRP